jgi:hypothetical protein
MNTFYKGLALVTPTVALSILFLFATPESSKVHTISWLVVEFTAIVVVAITSLAFLLALVTITLIGFRFLLGLQIKVSKSKITESTDE